jgi:hypothetical protein
MPYPDSEYPSILRGRDKRESQRLMAAAPELLALLKDAVAIMSGWSFTSTPDAGDTETVRACKAAIAKAEGRE